MTAGKNKLGSIGGLILLRGDPVRLKESPSRSALSALLSGAIPAGFGVHASNGRLRASPREDGFALHFNVAHGNSVQLL